jgi:hypothetical protein
LLINHLFLPIKQMPSQEKEETRNQAAFGKYPHFFWSYPINFYFNPRSPQRTLSGSSGSQTSGAQVRHLRISVPLVACLLDGQKYFSPDTPCPRPPARSSGRCPASLGHRSPHHDAALAQDGGNAPRRRRACGRRSTSTSRAGAAPCGRNATGGSQGPGGETTP